MNLTVSVDVFIVRLPGDRKERKVQQQLPVALAMDILLDRYLFPLLLMSLARCYVAMVMRAVCYFTRPLLHSPLGWTINWSVTWPADKVSCVIIAVVQRIFFCCTSHYWQLVFLVTIYYTNRHIWDGDACWYGQQRNVLLLTGCRRWNGCSVRHYSTPAHFKPHKGFRITVDRSVASPSWNVQSQTI